jgi:N-methylhydantoinase A
MVERLRLGVDVGGTFTDIVLLTSDGTALPMKVLSSPPEFNRAVRAGIEMALEEYNFQPAVVSNYTHGATVATNAIITRTGAATGLITTKGFRDVLEIRRMRMHKLYDIHWEKPKPLVPRHLRLEVPARTDPRSSEVTPLDKGAVRAAVERLMKEGVESVAVCYLHSYANGTNELDTREIIREMAPELSVSLSCEVLPEIKEYERTSTTVINAYVQPVVTQYARAMEEDLREIGIDVPIMVMQSNGGMMPLELAREFPIHIIESGPAAGVTGAFHLAKRMGIQDAMTLDMGGTTAKAGIIEEGEISRSPEYEVGGEVSIGHRLMKGSGYLLRVPSIDLAEVGAGGGSIAWTDPAGALKVGPHSAGANPGPACYDNGGVEPTITDANVHMGLTNPESLAGGTLAIRRDLAEKAITDRVAGRLGLDLTKTAWGIRTIANSSLIRALRAVSTERGRDPRRFVLFAFGGMGPAQALDVAGELGIGKVIVPPLPGLFSSLGLLFAEVEHHLIQTHYADTGRMDYDRINAIMANLPSEAAATLEREGYGPAQRRITLSADTRYEGQDYALTIPLGAEKMDPPSIAKLIADFHQEHEKTYGYRSDAEPVQIVALRCLARGLSEEDRVPESLNVPTAKDWNPAGSRRCYFGPEHGWVETDVMSRQALSGGRVQGPAIVEEDNSLTVVLPGWKAMLDEWSNIILENGS